VVEFFREHCFLEICGDDSRTWCLTEYGCQMLGAVGEDGQVSFAATLQGWKEWLPWDVKIEGMCLLPHEKPFAERIRLAPPMISRNLVVVDGYLWSPLYNPNRVLRRLAHHENERDEQELVYSAQATLSLHCYWHSRGLIDCPAVAWLEREFPEYWDPEFVQTLVTSAYLEAVLHVGACTKN
jgi:hypothetical protein